MKKNNGIVGIVIGVVLGVLVAVASVVSALLILQKPKIIDCVLIAIFAVIGLIGGYLCHNLLHEVGHMLFAEKSGARVFEVAFCGFVFTKGEKTKLNLKSGVGGWTSFLPKMPEKSEKVLLSSLIGGLVGSFLSFFAAYLLFQVGRFFSLYSLVVIFGFDSAVTIYLIVLNFFSLKDGTDGQLLIFKNNKPNEYFRLKVAELEYQSYLFNGKSAKEIEKLTCVNLNYSTIFDVEKSLQTGDLHGAKGFIESILKTEKIDGNGLIDLLLEDLFIAIVTKDVDNIDIKANKVYNCLLEPDSLLSYRVAMFYRRYTDEIAWAEGLEKTYLRLLEKNPLSGYKKQEAEIHDLYHYW